jgi:hypothetical protein
VSTAREIRAGRTCLLSSVSNRLLEHDSRLTEEMLFLFGQGNRLDHRVEEHADGPSVYLGHHSADIAAAFFTRFGIPHERRSGSAGDEALLRELRACLVDGQTIVIWVDMASLGYLSFNPPPGAIHALSIEAEAGGVLTLVDCFVPAGLYSEQVKTLRFELALGAFEAWRRTAYCRHVIDVKPLARHALHLERADIRQALHGASADYLSGSAQAPAVSAVLAGVADGLSHILQGRSATARGQICWSLAYSIRYFGILWSREFIARVTHTVAAAENDIELHSMAELFQASLRQWKLVMLSVLKIAQARDWLAQTHLAAQKIHALVKAEQDLHERLLRRLAA